MARNPYGGFAAAADPYLNGNGSSNSVNGSGMGEAGDVQEADDYDPYGDRYGTPAVPALRNPQPPRDPPPPRDRRAGRQGGYGGFFEPGSDSSGASARRGPGSGSGGGSSGGDRGTEDRGTYNGYGSRNTGADPDELTAPTRSPRRMGGAPDARGMPRFRDDGGSADGGRGDYRRGGGYDANTEQNNGEMLAPRSRGNGRSPGGGGGGDGTRQIEEVLQYIQSEWAFMAQDKCVPVQVALQLMDSSSLGRAQQYGQFQDTHKQLQRALKAIVNEHHQGFNSSIGTFHKIQSSIQTSQSRLRGLKDSLGEAKTGLSMTRPELKGLAATSQSYDEMLQALTQIEQLRLVTDKLEARISEKRFLTAVDVLQDALRMVRKPEMDNIGALSDLKIYLANQETSLTDILIEELHSHLYLKSPYCQDRWKAYVREQSSGVSSEGRDIAIPAIQPLYQFLEDFDFSIPVVEDPSRNPESDSFYYIQLLVESLNKMGRLEAAVTAIEQRLPVELFRVVDKTNNEVDSRHPTSLRGTTRNSKGTVDLGIGENDIRSVVVYDLLWTLYARFEAIAEGHRVFHDVIVGIAKRENIRNTDSLTGSFKELWLLYQNEIRSLLHDYLATDSNMYRMSQSIDPNADVFRKGQRKRDKKIFSLSDGDPKSVEMTTELEDLEAILKSSVPGLVSSSKRPIGDDNDEKDQQTEGSATGHKLLIEPSVFNMGLLLPPSLGFLQRLKDIVPPRPDIKTSTLTSFLDDFLVNVFLPQLDETLVKLSSQVFEETDAFQEDPQWAQFAARPIFRGSATFFNLITAFCRMLDTIPHDQAFSQLIVTQMVSYYEKCSKWYTAMVSKESSSSGTSLKASAAIASGPGDIHDTLKNLWTAEETGERRELIEKELGLLILQTNEVTIQQADIIQDRKTIASLCLLYTSMRWLASKIEGLRHITQNEADSSRRNTVRQPQGRRWTLLGDTAKIGDPKAMVYLPMTQETVVAFDSIVAQYQELAGLVLLTLHMEPRLRIIHILNLALRPPPLHSTVNANTHLSSSSLSSATLQHSPYLLLSPSHDPDPLILSLNASLVSHDTTTSNYFRTSEIMFLRSGLGKLVDNLLVANAGLIGRMNKNGCGRMQINILVLQQNLKNVEGEVSLRRAERYFELFSEGPEAVVKVAKAAKESEADNNGTALNGNANAEEKYSYEELKTLLELCYSEQLADPERGVSTVARRSMGDRLLQLSEVMWES